MTPAEHLAQLSHALHLIAHDWPLWASRSLPDGFAARTPGSGLPGGSSDISDPTGQAAIIRLALTVDEGGDLEAQALEAASHAFALSMRVWRHAQGSDAAPIPMPFGASVGLVCQMAGDALENSVRFPARFRGRPDVAGVTVRDVLDAIQADTVTLRQIIPARKTIVEWAKEELCSNPPYTTGERPHDHDIKPVPAVTRDQLCRACYERLRRAESKETAA